HLDFVPGDIQTKIQHWSDWIDFWGVDFDFQNGIFTPDWLSFRTRKNRKLQLKILCRYPIAGNYTICVKIRDILGLETIHPFNIKVLE
ncbi:MAG: DNA methyltransferase, partial [Candidatus Helarchaeota archaeon]